MVSVSPGSASSSIPSKASVAAHDGVVESLEPGPVVADVVRTPEAAELPATGRELADQVVQVLVVRVAPGLGA
jgi:hypothetical protein